MIHWRGPKVWAGNLVPRPAPSYLQHEQPQVQPFPGHLSPHVQVVQVHFGLLQFAWAFSADFALVFMASMVCCSIDSTKVQE